MAEEHDGQAPLPEWVQELRQQNEQLRGEMHTLREHASQQQQFLTGLTQGIAASQRQGQQGQAVDWDRRFYEAPTETFHALAAQYRDEMGKALREQEERLTSQSRAQQANQSWWQVFYQDNPHLRGMERVCAAVAKEIEPELIKLDGESGRKALLRALGPAALPSARGVEQGTTRTLSTERRGVARPGGVPQGRPRAPEPEDEDEWGGTVQLLKERRERREQARRQGPTRHLSLLQPERATTRRTG